MRISDKTAVQSILFVLKNNGVRQVVYSPGSRNAPFAISLADNPDFDVQIVVDERSAAFIALGMAQQLQHPVALICTSGTAPLNYAPAIAEAYYQGVPLIVITADRPPESINQGEGQCIVQGGIYDNFLKVGVSLTADNGKDDSVIANHRAVYSTILSSFSQPFGPVHINVPLYEPLYETTTRVDQRTQDVLSFPHPLATEVVNFPEWDSKLNYLLLIGQQVPSEDWRDLIGKALQLPNVIILSESHGNAHGLGAIDQIDRWIMALTDDQRAHLQWDVVISLGHNVISRKVKTLIKAKCKAHWSVQFQKHPINTYRLNPKLFHCTSVQFLENWLPKDLYGEGHVQHQINANHTKMLDDYFSQRMHSDLKLFYHLSLAFPPHAMIQAGNSSVVRYLQLMSQRSDLVYYGNRGVSGIDGATSTAVGASRISARPVILVTGDLSFLYDANGLWMDQWPKNLKIVVVDNGGGGIFRIIEGAKEEPTVPVFFETPHGRDIVKWVRGWGWNAQELIESNVERLKDFFKDDQSQVLVIKTPTEVNPIELDLFFQFFKEYNERMENHQRIH